LSESGGYKHSGRTSVRGEEQTGFK